MSRRWHYECDRGHKLNMARPISTCQALNCQGRLTAVGEGAREENARLRGLDKQSRV